MQTFSCKVLTPQGQIAEIKIKENDKMSCMKKLKKHGMTPISIEPSFNIWQNKKSKKITATIHSRKKKKSFLLKTISDIELFNKVSIEEIKDFTEDLYALRKSGFSTKHSLRTIMQKTENLRFKECLKDSENMTEQELAEINNKISNIPSIEKELLSMEREKEIKQKIYLFLLQKKEETQFVMTSSNSTGLIIDKAYTFANSITPNTKQTLCFAIIITILISLCYIYIEYIFTKKIYNKDQIKDLTAINIIGEITSPEQNNELEFINKSNNEKEINSFRTIRTALQLINKEKAKNQTILITSTTNDSCNNYIAINLALSYANLKKKTILINLNLHNPTKYEYLDNTKGISEYLWDDECQLTEIIQNHYQNQYLSLISSGCKIENPTEALSSDKLITLMDFLRNNFEYIIVDTTPITKETPDTLLLGSLANTTLFICKKKSTQKSDIKALNKFINDKILNNVHIVFEQTT